MAKIVRFWRKGFFRLRGTIQAILGWIRRLYWVLQGMVVGTNTLLPSIWVSWPHQVQIGNRCVLESNIVFKFDGIHSPGPSIVISDYCFLGHGCEFNIRKGVQIGSGCAIASGCKFIDHDHGVVGRKIDEKPGPEASIRLGEHVWLGANVVVLKGVSIEDGAVVGAGSVVTKSIGAYEIWAGVPARKIKDRPARAF